MSQNCGHLSDGEDEDQIEEELDEGRTLLLGPADGGQSKRILGRRLMSLNPEGP